MATPGLDDWTEEKCLELIREYRKKPLLWDKKNQFFFRRNLKPMAWEKIGAALNVRADKCKHKMGVLMSSFRREKSKLVNSLRNLTDDDSTDSPGVYKSTWFAFDALSFLLDKESERKRQANDSDVTDELVGDTSIINLSLLRKEVHSRPKKKARISSDNDTEASEPPDIPQPQVEAGLSQTTAERDEEIMSFTTFIGNKMKKYSDKTKNAVQQAICAIIFKADQKHYERNCYETLTIIDEEGDPLCRQTYEYIEQKPVIKTSDSDSD